ncbi:MAG: DUF1553 domain-containing protein [Planctomycetota bacterium]|nr:DUF1553 domain-containing protein [Planctomycetota bacterium]
MAPHQRILAALLAILCVARAAVPPAPLASEPKIHWSFKSPVAAALPAGLPANWGLNPIDAFVAAAHARAQLGPAPPATPRSLIRRLSFNLTGLPPTPPEVEAFVRAARVDRQAALHALTNRLLSSTAYGVRWARHWLDTVRYTDYLREDPLGANKAPLYELYEAYRYRDWVVDALNRDMPYDVFVRHQIAGDLLPNPDGSGFYPDGLIATSVLAFGFWENGCADKKKVVSDIVDDQIDVVGKAFLGLTLACARCHDHKFDPLTQEDYYALAGIFYSSRVLQSVGKKGDHTVLLRTSLRSPQDRERQQQARAEIAALQQELYQAQSQLPAAAKLVAWFDFEENTRTSTADNVGPYVGRLHGNAVIDEGKFGHGVTLDGDGDFVDGTAQPEFLVETGTIMAWFRYDPDIRSEGQIAGMPFHPTKWTDPYYALQAWISPDGTHLGAQSNHKGGRIQTIFSAASHLDIGPNEWHHVAAIYDGRCVRMVVDGRPVGAAVDGGTARGTIRYEGAPNLTIGTRNVIDTGNFFKGTIDEVKLFDGALNTDQIRAAMRSPVPQDFAVGFRDGTIPQSLALRLDSQRAEVALRLAEIDARTRAMRTEFPPDEPLAMAIQEGGTPDSLFPGFQDIPVHIGGRYDRLGAVVRRRMPVFLAGRDQPSITEGSGRRELAQWVTSRDNPLTARVIVNRVWQHHFGQGLVRTANNFGVLGETPTHPQLLDWLAGWFMDEGWSLKKLHRLIVTSATYQQSVTQDVAVVDRDVDNRLLTRMPARRLAWEPLRDAMLAVAGRLDLSQGGPAESKNSAPRRSLYIQTRRFDRNEPAMLFDCANPEQAVARRTVSTTAPQALYILNNAFVKQQAAALATRLGVEHPMDDSARIQRAYALLFARPASDREVGLALDFITSAPNREQGWIEYAQVLLASNEFFYLE